MILLFVLFWCADVGTVVGGGGRGELDFFFFFLSVQQTTSGTGHRVN